MTRPLSAADLNAAHLCIGCEATHTSGQCHKCRRPLCTACGGDSEICDGCASAAEFASEKERDR